MNNETLNEYIDAHNGIHGAIKAAKDTISRRATEGKASPNAEAMLEALMALPVGYQTPKAAERHHGWVSSGGFMVG